MYNYCPFFSLVRVTALHIEDDNVGRSFHTEPNSFGGLSDALLAVKYFEICSEEGVEEGTFA